MLWLSIHLPLLPLEVFSPTEAPLAVCAGPDNSRRVHACNPAAADCGVQPGQSLNSALALCHELITRPRDAAAEEQALFGLAVWAQQFSPAIHLPLSEGLLLEIGGSLRLFGGAEPLVERVHDDLVELGYSARLAAAPTPLGSWLLARNEVGQIVTGREALHAALNQLPLSGLELAAEVQATLRGMGLRQVGDLLRQPRPELARRLGQGLFDYLDRALGHRPDPRRPVVLPATFDRRLPLPAEVETTGALLFAVRRLVLELVGLLRAKGAGVQSLLLHLEHRGRADSRIEVGLMRPSRDADHLLALFKERLERFELSAPTDALRLSAERFPDLETPQEDLFAKNRTAPPDGLLLVERLRARLGGEAVNGLALQADHRPEQAWRPGEPGQTTAAHLAAGRPLWFMEKPLALDAPDGHPRFHGPLHLTTGPERIESGWWDGLDVARDYFVAEDRAGERFWIFRDRRSGSWFMQGIFG